MFDRQAVDPSDIACDECDDTILTRISRTIPSLLSSRVLLPISGYCTFSFPKNTSVKDVSRWPQPLHMHAHEDLVGIRYMFDPLLNYFVF